MKILKASILCLVLSIFLAVNAFTAYVFFYDLTYVRGLDRGYVVGFNQGKAYEARRIWKYFIEHQEELCFPDEVTH